MIKGSEFSIDFDIVPLTILAREPLSGFSAGTGYLTALDMQFKTGSDVSSSVTLISAPGGSSAWSLEDISNNRA